MTGRILAFAALLLVAGCNRSTAEPSQDDIRAALKTAGYRGGPKAEKLACKTSSERPGVICDYRAPACNRYTGTCGAARPYTGRFLQASSRWQLVEDLTPRAQQDPATQPLPGVIVAGPTPAVPAAEPTVEAPPAEVEPSTAPPAPPSLPPHAPDYDAPRDDAPDYGRPERRDEGALTIGELNLTVRWLRFNTTCRMGQPSAPDTNYACEQRDLLAQRLEGLGLCQTRSRGWRRCD